MNLLQLIFNLYYNYYEDYYLLSAVLMFFYGFWHLYGSVPVSAKSNIQFQDIPPTTSMVYPGSDGRLVYVADSLGNKIPDFSNAGYKGGGVPIPYVAIKEIVWPVLGDNSGNIQAAIDRVSALPLDASGFRGAVLLKMGEYELEKPIYIKASGVVLRGEGMSDIGTILIAKIPKDRQTYGRGGLINISGASAIARRKKQNR